MKQLVGMVVVFLALSTLALADNSVDFTNRGGTLNGSSAGLTLTGSELIAVDGLKGTALTTGNLGSVTFSTGSLKSGSLQTGAIFNAGGSFVITGDGTNGIPSAVIFNGTFSGPVTWSVSTAANGTHTYMLSGNISGTWSNGQHLGGHTVQVTVSTGRSFFGGSVMLDNMSPYSSTNFHTVVPEPGALALLGTGLVGLAGLLRLKAKS